MSDPSATGKKPPLDAAAKRKRDIIRWTLTILAAAIGITLIAAVGPALFGQHKQPVGITVMTPRQQSDALMKQAQAALAAGETTAAALYASNAAAADPTNAAATALVKQLSGGSSTPSTPSGSSGSVPPTSTSNASTTTPAPSPDAGYTKAIKNLSALLPTNTAGLSLEPEIDAPGSVSISASSGSGRYIWTVHDAKSVQGAHSFVTKTSKVLYGKNPATITVHGVSAYYGTDGQRIATVTYTRGRYVFELLLSAQAGQAEAAKAAAMFRDAPVK